MNTVGRSCLLSDFRVIPQYRNQLLIYLVWGFLHICVQRDAFPILSVVKEILKFLLKGTKLLKRGFTYLCRKLFTPF